jgi:hypothetical protein
MINVYLEKFGLLMLQGIDALNRVAFDAAAHTIRTRSPISLPLIAPVTQDEDLKNLENLRQIMSIFNKSRDSSAVGTVAGMTGENGATRKSTNSQTSTQVSSPQVNVSASNVFLFLSGDLHALNCCMPFFSCHLTRHVIRCVYLKVTLFIKLFFWDISEIHMCDSSK